MKTFNSLYILAFSVMFLSFLGCTSTPERQGAGGYLDDTAITAKVKLAIVNEPTLKATEINVETFKGVVQLSGFVASQNDINRAIEVAQGVPGVKSVKNDMRVK